MQFSLGKETRKPIQEKGKCPSLFSRISPWGPLHPLVPPDSARSPAGTRNGARAVFFTQIDTDATVPRTAKTEKNPRQDAKNVKLPNKPILISRFIPSARAIAKRETPKTNPNLRGVLFARRPASIDTGCLSHASHLLNLRWGRIGPVTAEAEKNPDGTA